MARRRSPHTRQTPFLREPLRTCERHSSAALQRLSRRRSPHTRQTPFLREPLRTCERHFVRHRFNAWHAGVRRIRGRRRSCA
ncbi:hypothetical protein AQ915_06415, partial [Burkholderia pseudomallei]